MGICVPPFRLVHIQWLKTQVKFVMLGAGTSKEVIGSEGEMGLRSPPSLYSTGAQQAGSSMNQEVGWKPHLLAY